MYMFHRGSEGKCLYFVLNFVSIKCLLFRCGLFAHCRCMHYEAKHKYFKKIAMFIGNFKNVEKTVPESYVCVTKWPSRKYFHLFF